MTRIEQAARDYIKALRDRNPKEAYRTGQLLASEVREDDEYEGRIKARAVAYRVAAKEQYHQDGEIEIDEDAVVSIDETDEQGAYVAAWVWVPMVEEGDG